MRVSVQVYTPNLPPAPALPVSLPPYTAAGQPAVQYILHGSLPLASCGVPQSPAPGPPALPAVSEPAAYSSGTSNSEERAAAPRPAAEKAKNEEVSVGPRPTAGLAARPLAGWSPPMLAPST